MKMNSMKTCCFVSFYSFNSSSVGVKQLNKKAEHFKMFAGVLDILASIDRNNDRINCKMLISKETVEIN